MKNERIKDCFPIIRNGASVKQDKATGGIPITRIESIYESNLDLERLGYAGINDESLSGFYLEDGDILMSHINSVTHLGKVAIFEKRKEIIIHGMNLLCLKANKTIVIPKYAFYYFRSPIFINSLKKITKKSVNQASFNISNFKNLSFPLQKIEDQIKIANILGNVEALIKQRKESIDLLDVYLKSTFLKMFGNPVRNEKGWKTKKLNEIVKVGTGGTPSRQRESEFYGGNINWAKTTEVNGSYILSTEEKVTDLALKQSNCNVYPIGTILLAMYGQGKTRGNVGFLNIEAATNQACAAIPPSEDINQIFLFHLLKQSYKFLRSLARGGNQANLNLSIVGNIKIILPDDNLQNYFAGIVKKIELLKLPYLSSLQELENLFSSLSQKAFKGELDLSNIVLKTNKIVNLKTEANALFHKTNKSKVVEEIKKEKPLPTQKSIWLTMGKLINPSSIPFNHIEGMAVLEKVFNKQQVGFSFQEYEQFIKKENFKYTYKDVKEFFFGLLEEKRLVQFYASKEWVKAMRTMGKTPNTDEEFSGEGSIWFLMNKMEKVS